jgi:hypothetical protein
MILHDSLIGLIDSTALIKNFGVTSYGSLEFVGFFGLRDTVTYFFFPPPLRTLKLPSGLPYHGAVVATAVAGGRILVAKNSGKFQIT